jgi:hypothetical protein
LAAPQFVANGPVTGSTGALSVAWPTHETDDIGILWVETANQTVSTPAGWTLIANTGTGTAGNASATALWAFWKRAASAAEAAVAITDTGTRQTAFIQTFRGCLTGATPIDVSATSTASGSASVSITGGTTTVVDTLCVAAVSNALAWATAETVRPSSIANASLASLTKRKNTQVDGTGGSVSNFLPVGMFSTRDPGVGPGNPPNFADPRYKCIQYGPAPNTIAQDIRDADTHNVLLVLTIPGQKPQWNNTAGVYDPSLYAQKLDRFVFGAPGSTISEADALTLTDAINRRRVVCYINDEPNLNNHSTPAQQDEMAAMHKARWPGCITIIRCSPRLLRNGWPAGPVPSTKYPHIDYAWIQYTTAHTSLGKTPAQVWAEERAHITAGNLDMGLCTSLNLQAGGITWDTNGVLACWDVNNDSISNGVLLGDRQTDSPGGFPRGTYRTCAQAGPNGSLLPSPGDCFASPEWIEKFVDLAIADGEFPFVLFWNDGNYSSGSAWALPWHNRSDFITAFDNTINAGLAATAAPWRTAK